MKPHEIERDRLADLTLADWMQPYKDGFDAGHAFAMKECEMLVAALELVLCEVGRSTIAWHVSSKALAEYRRSTGQGEE